jgi:hypothetical protein
MCGCVPTELQYYDSQTNKRVYHFSNLSLMKGGKMSEYRQIVMTYTARVIVKKQTLIHVEIRDPFSSLGGRHYYMPMSTTIGRLKLMHGRGNCIWKCQLTKRLLRPEHKIRHMLRNAGRACIVVVNDLVSLSSDDTEQFSSDNEPTHPRAKRQKRNRTQRPQPRRHSPPM